jgi:hypothetical protein
MNLLRKIACALGWHEWFPELVETYTPNGYYKTVAVNNGVCWVHHYVVMKCVHCHKTKEK